MNQPLVTVYISTYNRVDLLKRAVESVRNQTYTNLEIIIVDDCSTDETHQYLKEVSDLDQRIRYFIKDKNSGACVSRNIAIQNASGEYITGLDDDDYFTTDRIDILLQGWFNVLAKNKCVSGIYSNYFIISKNRNRISNVAEVSNLKMIKKTNCIGNQIFTKTEIIRRVNGFDEDMPAWQDYELWYRLIKNVGCMYKVGKHPTYFMDESHSATRITTSNSEKILKAYTLFVNKHKDSLTEKDSYILYFNYLKYDSVKINLKDIFDSIKFLKFKLFIKIYLKKKWHGFRN